MSTKIDKNFNTSGSYKKFTLNDLRRFVIRARIVQEHSLAADIGKLNKLSKNTLSLNLLINKETKETSYKIAPITLLPPEQVESAAARVRPIFLHADGVFYADVLAFIYERIDNVSLRHKVLEILELFHNADPDYPKSSKGRTRPPDTSVSNKELAGAWLYGALLHEDSRRRSFSEGFHLENVYIAATQTVAAMMLATVKALHLIELLVTQEIINLPESLWTDSVTITPGPWVYPGEAKIFTAEVGTEPSNISSILSGDNAEWEEFNYNTIFKK